MLFNNKFVSLSLALVVGVVTMLSSLFVKEIQVIYIVITGLTAFFICYVTSMILLDLIIFKEIKNLYQKILKLDDKNSSLAAETGGGFNLNKMSTELFNYSEKKNKEIKKMKEVELFRRQFLADIAHELKTPVHIAQGFIDTLINGAIDDLEVRDRFLAKTSTSLENLDMIIRDLINISHLETGEIKPVFDKVDLDSLLKKIIAQLEEKGKSKNKTIHYITPNHPIFVNIDEFRMEQVLTNLINNAINYSGENKNIWIKIIETGKKYKIEIVDDGIGIDKIHHDKIFNRFYRVEKSRSKEQGGTGLGLAIAKHIVEAHGAELKLDSELGRGARFFFSLEKIK